MLAKLQLRIQPFGEAMIRPLALSDLVTLLTHRGRPPYYNEAATKDNLQPSPATQLPVGAFVGRWLPLRKGGQGWVWIEKGHLEGLISSRRRSDRKIWEVDNLLLTGQDKRMCLALLDSLSSAGGKLRVTKIFLRIPQTSPVIEMAQGAGFSPYLEEHLYRLQARPSPRPRKPDFPPYSFRPRQESDGYDLFQVYTAAVPPPVRCAEGMTLQEWQQTRERRTGKGRPRELMCYREGSLVGWLRVRASSGVGQMELIVHPAEESGAEAMLRYSLARLSRNPCLLCLTPTFQGELQRLLRQHQFEEIAKYTTLVKELAVRVAQPIRAPQPIRGPVQA
jgi:hypothetical protein